MRSAPERPSRRARHSDVKSVRPHRHQRQNSTPTGRAGPPLPEWAPGWWHEAQIRTEHREANPRAGRINHAGDCGLALGNSGSRRCGAWIALRGNH